MVLLFFYFFGVCVILGALGAISFRNPIYCGLSLVSSFVSLGAIYILMNAEFIAMVQILIYAGAIMVLFLFIIMLLRIQPKTEKITFKWYKIGGMVLVGFFMVQAMGIIMVAKWSDQRDIYSVQFIQEKGFVKLVGDFLYGKYLVPFEAVSLLFLISVMGAVAIAKQKPKKT